MIIIAHIISSLKIGGAEALLVDLIRELGSQNYEHHVIFIHDGPRRQQLHDLGVKTYHVRRPNPWAVYKLIKKIKPNAIHGALWAGCWLARIVGKLTKIPVVCVVHLPIYSDGKLRNTLDAFTWRWAQRVIAVSEGVAQSLETKWVPAHKLSLVPNGINYELTRTAGFKYRLTRETIGLSPEHLVFGCVGRFVAHKRQDLLVRAFAQVIKTLPHARLVLMGVGPQEKYLRDLVIELKLEHYVQIIVGKPALGYYPLFDVFVLPSILEGLSIALLESMCFGLPAIVVGQRDVITDQLHGLVIPGDNEQALVHAMNRMGDSTLRHTWGQAAQMHVHNNFTLQVMAAKYDKLFQDAAS